MTETKTKPPAFHEQLPEKLRMPAGNDLVGYIQELFVLAGSQGFVVTEPIVHLCRQAAFLAIADVVLGTAIPKGHAEISQALLRGASALGFRKSTPSVISRANQHVWAEKDRMLTEAAAKKAAERARAEGTAMAMKMGL